MRIALLSSSDQPVYFFPALSRAIAEKAPQVSIEEFFVPFANDLPFSVKQSVGFDLIAVSLVFDGEEDASSMAELSRLMVLAELQGKTRVLKMMESLDGADYDSPENWEETQQMMVDKWSNIILGLLFDSSIFKPGQLEEEPESEDSDLQNP